MNGNLHQTMRQIVDKTLLDAASGHEQQMLREHVAMCVSCREYQNACNRVVKGLSGFSFEVNPALEGKVMASLRLRAQQLELRSERLPMWQICLAALLLTGVGSFAAGRFSSLAVAVFHLEPSSLQLGVLALWIVPSLCFCLLFPVLYQLSKGEKGPSK